MKSGSLKAYREPRMKVPARLILRLHFASGRPKMFPGLAIKYDHPFLCVIFR
jgi:hypothetical protein